MLVAILRDIHQPKRTWLTLALFSINAPMTDTVEEVEQGEMLLKERVVETPH